MLLALSDYQITILLYVIDFRRPPNNNITLLLTLVRPPNNNITLCY